jgi:hypothetical protein
MRGDGAKRLFPSFEAGELGQSNPSPEVGEGPKISPGAFPKDDPDPEDSCDIGESSSKLPFLFVQAGRGIPNVPLLDRMS